MEPHRIFQVSAITLFAFVSSALTVTSPVAGQTFPSQTIRIVVGSAAGTPPDIVSRIVANHLSESEGWRVVVENKPGAMTTLAVAEVLKQPADGHSIVPVTLSTS